MIYVGIDDTDTADTPGTNQLARALVAHVADRYECWLIVRHQLLEDPRVPCTSKNGSASIQLTPVRDEPLKQLIERLRHRMRQWFVAGSDPGLCVTVAVPEAISAFGQRCQRELVNQRDARELAARYDIHLEGLGGNEGGVIGALAAVGLAAGGDDGRVVQIGSWPDDLAGPQDLGAITERGIEVRHLDSELPVMGGRVDVGKHLRPSFREHKTVLFVRPVSTETGSGADWLAVKLP